MTREKEIYRVTLVGSAGNLALLTFKFVAGVLGHSAAMVADAVHSLSDFFTDIIVLLFVKLSAKPQDESHDYGHGKFETLATLFIGLALLGAAIGIIVSGAVKFAHWLGGETLEVPGRLALWAALVSIVVKELLYRYTVARGRKLESQAVVANAWHHRSDALSSIGAAIGIGGAILLGERWAVLDPLASIVVGGMLIKVAWDLLRGSLGELTDQSLSADEEREILEIITSFPGVSEPHNLRTRRIGKSVAIEAHIRMDGELPLGSAHEQASAIERKLKKRFGSGTLVSLHMEPEKNALSTERILLRPWRESDAPVLYKYASDPEVGPRAGWSPHKSVQESLEVIRTVFRDATNTWAIVLKDTGEPVGAMGYGPSCQCNLPAREGEPLVGYWVGRPYWNQGICTEALRLMIGHIRSTTPIRSLIGGHFIDNPASGRVLEKCGFVPTGESVVDPSQGKDTPIRVLRLEL